MADGLLVRVRQSTPIPLDAELSCPSGEVLALTGPSGGGKTTLLRLIAGLARAEDARIECSGEVWLDTGCGVNLPVRQRRVGFVFQNYALFPHMTALSNVEAALGDLSPVERRARAIELLERVHLAGLESRRPAELSGGQQQRVAVARALARDPKVLLLDEPFSAVDRATRERLYRELAELRRDLRMPMILVTHDLEEAAMLSDRMCILHHGRTLQTALPYELMARPETPLVARLIGLRNVFKGMVVAHREHPGQTLINWDGRVLEARLQTAFPAGASVSWAVPSAFIVLHRRDRPSRGEHENPVSGEVVQCVVLGEATSVVLKIDGAALHFSLPTHVALRNRLERGAQATVSLLAEGIHLMPLEDGTPEEPA